jgi:hypothetical protein
MNALDVIEFQIIRWRGSAGNKGVERTNISTGIAK